MGFFFLLGIKTWRVPKVCHILITITRQFSLSCHRLFSRFCALLISCPGAFIIGQLSSARVVGWGAREPTQCHNFAHNTHRRMSPSGPQWVNWSAEAHFYLCHCLPCAMIASKWDEERPSLFRFLAFFKFIITARPSPVAVSLRFQLTISLLRQTAFLHQSSFPMDLVVFFPEVKPVRVITSGRH